MPTLVLNCRIWVGGEVWAVSMEGPDLRRRACPWEPKPEAGAGDQIQHTSPAAGQDAGHRGLDSHSLSAHIQGPREGRPLMWRLRSRREGP